MHDLSPGQEVHVSGMHGGAAEVVYVRGSNVRVRMLSTHCPRTVPLSRVTLKRESKALSAASVFDGMEVVPSTTHPYHMTIRPVPKPVTLRSEPYLAYVRKHPCCLCGRSEGIEAHHWSHHGGVMGSKVDDYRTVPLCQEHHRYWHDHGTLPEMDREASEAFFLRTQRALLEERAAWADDGDIVDGLIRAIGGTDA